MANYTTPPAGAKATNPGGWTEITVDPPETYVYQQGNVNPPPYKMYIPPPTGQTVTGTGGVKTSVPNLTDQWGNAVDANTIKPVYWGSQNALVGWEFVNPLTGERNFAQASNANWQQDGLSQMLRQTDPMSAMVAKDTAYGPIHQMMNGNMPVFKLPPTEDPTWGLRTEDVNEVSPFTDEAVRTLAALAGVAAGGLAAGTAAFGAPTGLAYTAAANPAFAGAEAAMQAGAAGAAGGAGGGLGAASESVTGPALGPIDAAGTSGGGLGGAGGTAGGSAWETALGGGVGSEFGTGTAVTGLGGAETGGLGALTGELGTVAGGAGTAGSAAGGLGGLGQGGGEVAGDIDFGGLGGAGGGSGSGNWGTVWDQITSGNIGGALETGGGALWDWISSNPQAAMTLLGGAMDLFSDPAEYDYTGGLGGGGGGAAGKQLPVLPPLQRTVAPYPGDQLQYGQQKVGQVHPNPGEWDFFGGTPIQSAAGGPIRGALDSILPPRYFDGGPGGGQDDLIDAKVSPGEFVFDASTVSDLGDGSNDEGARKLEEMVHRIRMHKRGGAKRLPPRAPQSPLAYLGESNGNL